MKEDMRRYNLWLAFTAGLRPMRHNELIEEYGSAYDVFLAAARGDIPSKTAADGRMLALMKAKAEEGYIDRCLEYLHNQKTGSFTTRYVTRAQWYPNSCRAQCRIQSIFLSETG